MDDSFADRPRPPHAPRIITVAALLWTGFVIYGSLLPFDYTPQSMSSAWAQFLRTPLLDVGPGSRADWLANLLLYLPLSFLWLAALDTAGSRVARPAATVAVVLVVCALAVALEFTQLFFPRTVSLNDLIAEMIGTLAGALAWWAARRRVFALCADFSNGGPAARRALGAAYVVIFVLLALFPFDFVMSLAEFAQKELGQRAAWWLAPQACARALQCPAQLAAEMLFALPIGVAVFYRGRSVGFVSLLAVGLLFGIVIEGLQLLLLSGVSQGASVLAKASGVVAGGLLAPRVGPWLVRFGRSPARVPAVIVLAIAYLAMVAFVLGFWRGNAIGWVEAIARLGEIRWLPFHHYYYTSEARAMASVVLQAAVFMPAGILMALGVRSQSTLAGGSAAATASGVLALAVQLSRLFHPPQRPDPTDVLIGAAAGAASYALTRWVLDSVERPAPDARQDGLRAEGVIEAPAQWLGKLAWVPALLAAGVLVATFPVARLALAAGFVVCCGLMWRWPGSWLVIVLALLPTVDLAPWSGRYYVDEFDLLMLAVLAMALGSRVRGKAHWPPWLTALFGLFALSGLVAIARGILPWPSPELASLAGYQSPLNAWRVGKGLVWALIALWLVGRDCAQRDDVGARFTLGMTLGLLGMGLVVAWERLVFTGPFNFQSDYRVAGPFSAISTAGAQIESYLGAAIPFAILLIRRGPGLLPRGLGVAALLLGLHAMAATASRTAYAAVLVAVLALALAMLWAAEGNRRRGVIIVAAATLATLLVTLLTSTYAGLRLNAIRHDFGQRQAHWALVLDLIGNDDTTKALGMGVGQYPATFLWGAPADRRPSTFAFLRDAGKGWLRLGAGRVVFVGQFVPVETGQTYVLRGRVRAQQGGPAVLNLALCDKWILYSYGDCQTAAVQISADGRGSGDWSAFARSLTASELGRGPPLFRRPVVLALYNGERTAIDVTDVALEDVHGTNLLKNGDFAHGGDHWYFSADDHFPWNIFNLVLEVYFEQGWLGLVGFIGLVGAVLWHLARRSLHGDLLGATFLSAILGYFVPGFFDSVIDDPRLRLLLLLLLCGCVLLARASSAPAGEREAHRR